MERLSESYKDKERVETRLYNAAEELEALKEKRENLVERCNQLENHPHKHLPHIRKLLNKLKDEILHIGHEIVEAEKHLLTDAKGLIAHEKAKQQAKEQVGENASEEVKMDIFRGQLRMQINTELSDNELGIINNSKLRAQLSAIQKLNTQANNNKSQHTPIQSNRDEENDNELDIIIITLNSKWILDSIV